MIKLTRLNGEEFVVNAELIRYVESRPDTYVTLINNDRLIVREPVAEVVKRAIAYSRAVRSLPSLSSTGDLRPHAIRSCGQRSPRDWRTLPLGRESEAAFAGHSGESPAAIFSLPMRFAAAAKTRAPKLVAVARTAAPGLPEICAPVDRGLTRPAVGRSSLRSVAAMVVIVGGIIVMGSVLAGFVWSGGHIGALCTRPSSSRSAAPRWARWS